MSFGELLLIAIGLSMDAFAVSICKGLNMTKMNYKKAIVIAGFFGIFQAVMPFIGYHLGLSFSDKVASIDHWIAFILLGLIGFNMIKESFQDDAKEEKDSSLKLSNLMILSIATSIDALVIGFTFAFFHVSIIPSITTIGITTFILCVIGAKIGNVFKEKYNIPAEIIGGIILIGLGIKILIEHLYF